jgi:hypothetical protein
VSAEITGTVQVYEALWSLLVVLGITANVVFTIASYRLTRAAWGGGEPTSVQLAAEGLLIRDFVRLMAQMCLLVPTWQAITRPAHGSISHDTWLFIASLITMEFLIVANAVIDKIWSMRIIERRRRESSRSVGAAS